jgi:hypothetical protein
MRVSQNLGGSFVSHLSLFNSPFVNAFVFIAASWISSMVGLPVVIGLMG